MKTIFPGGCRIAWSRAQEETDGKTLAPGQGLGPKSVGTVSPKGGAAASNE